MKTTLSPFRVFVVFLFVFGFLSPVASAAGAAQADVTCDDYSTQRKAQAALDDDPDLADALDPDGNGIACDDDSSNVRATDVQLPEETADATAEDQTPEDATSTASNGDGEQYLADIQDEVDSLQKDADRFLEIDDLGADATDAEVAELQDIADGWSAYADVADGITAPDGFGDIDDAYQTLADTVVEAGDKWDVYWETEPKSDAEQEALDDFNVSFVDMQDQLDSLNTLLDEARNGGTATEEATAEATDEATPDATKTSGNEDGDAYIATVQDEVDGLADSIDEFNSLVASVRDAPDADKPDIVDQFNAIAEDWSNYPDVAAEITAPDGFEEIDSAYQDLAAEVGDMGDNWQTFWTAEADSTEEQDAKDAFSQNLDNVQTQIDDLNTLLDEAGNGGTATEEATAEATDEATTEGTTEVDRAADKYLTTVRDNSDELSNSITRFTDILSKGADITDADVAEVGDILTLWADASDVATGLDAPSEYTDIQSAYEDLAAELGDAADNFNTYATATRGSTEESDARDAFTENLSTAEGLASDLDQLLTDAGY